MGLRGKLLAWAIVLPVAVAGLWIQHPWQRTAPTQQPAPCRLPVYLKSANTGGFLTVPGFAFTTVPGRTFSGASRSNDQNWSYDATLDEWLPVDQRQVSPDGTWWVYATPLQPSISASLHLVDRHRSDRTVWTGAGQAFPLGWTKSGPVFVHFGSPPQYHTEYLLIDPSTGALRSLALISPYPMAVDASGLWAIRNVPVGAASDSQGRSTVTRADIASGATVTWWDRMDSTLVLSLGFDQDQHPVLEITPTGGGTERIVRLTSPNVEEVITSDAASGAFSPISVLGDTRGIWFGDYQSAVWFWTPGHGLTRVAQVSTQSESVVIAGPCR